MKKLLLSILLTLLPLLASAETVEIDGIWYNLILKAQEAEVIKTEVTVTDAKKYYDSEFTLSQTYKITVYATKAGYENSEVATREIVIENGQTTLFGDLNKDGKVNVADHVKLSDIIMNK